MSRPNGPNSPLSRSSNDSAGFPGRFDGPTLSNATYGGPFAAPRPPQTSPPGSGHPSASTDLSRPSANGSSVGRPPSSASSVARSSYGRSSQRGPPPMPGPGPRSSSKPDTEDNLHRHYATLKTYLASSLQDEKGNIKPNRARDKLLRLSPTQFTELSTDVYDELIRREDERLQRVPNVPRFLPPKSVFHPKRNQARQKLSTLPLDRFKQLATDVFYELERRIPRIAARDMERPGSAASTRSRGGMRPPGPGGFRPPPPFQGDYPPGSPGMPPGGRPPQPKTMQSNTMIPNKSTMVEDDEEEEDEDEDAFGLDRVMSGLAERNRGMSSAAEGKKVEEQQLEIMELKQKLEALESARTEQGDWTVLREELERKHKEAERLNEQLRKELDQLHKDRDEQETDLQGQVHNLQSQTDDLRNLLEAKQADVEILQAQVGDQSKSGDGEKMAERIKLLETELATQEKLTNEVRGEATNYLHEMKALSQQNDHALEQEEKLAAQVSKMEKEVDVWRQRYARLKSQNKSLRASTMGLNLASSIDAGKLFRKDSLISENGLVKDVDITRFQLSVDELVQVARQPAAQPMLDSVKNVVISVQSITSSIGTDGYPTPIPSPSPKDVPQTTSVAKLKQRVTGTANALITATKQHSSAMGLSPITLLDAAASNLSAAVVDLVKVVGIRPSPQSELSDTMADLDVSEPPSRSHASVSSFYDEPPSPNDHSARSSDSLSNQTNGNRSHAPFAIQVQPPPASVSSTSSIVEPAEPVSPPSNGASDKPKPTPLNLGGLGRSNTMKKWFGWGRGGNDEAADLHTPIATTPQTATPSGGAELDDGYDEFR